MATKTEEKKKEEKKGAGWLGFGPASTARVAGTGARVVSAGAWHPAGQGALAALGHFLSSGTGMVALSLGVAGAMGAGLWTMNHPRGESSDSLDDGLQSLGEIHPGAAAGSSAAQKQAAAAKAGDSLSYLSKGNPDFSAGDESGTGGAAGQEAAASASPGFAVKGAPDNANARANTQGDLQKAPTFTPMKMEEGGGGGGGGGGGFHSPVSGGAADTKGQTLAPAPSGGGGGQATGKLGPGARGLAAAGGSGAMAQLENTAALSKAAAGANTPEGASDLAARAFDNAMTGAVNPLAAGGAGMGQGAAESADNGQPITSLNKTIQPAPAQPAPGQNATPWQGMVYGAMGLMAMGGLLLMLANAKIPSLAPYKQYLALAATAAGTAAAALGALIMTRYQQQMQGMIFVGGGGLIAALGLMTALGGGTNSQLPANAQVNAATGVVTDPAGNFLGTISGGTFTPK